LIFCPPRAVRLTLLGEEFSDVEFFYTAMPDGLPFVPDEQPLRLPIKDEMPAIHVSRSRASRVPVKLQFDRHRRHCSAPVALHIYERTVQSDAHGKPVN
jgi:hypothetical protein